MRKRPQIVPEITGDLAVLQDRVAAIEHEEHPIFVFKRASAPKGIEGVYRIGDDILAVWDEEDPATDVYLRVALSMARALAVRECSTGEETEENLRQIEQSVREIEKQVKAIDAIAKSARVVQSKGETILEAAEAMKAALEEQLEALRESVQGLRGSPRE